MAHHNALHDSLRALPPPCATEAADALATRRTCLLKCALHAADLHVPTLPWASSVGWVRALGNEFKSMVEQARICVHETITTTVSTMHVHDNEVKGMVEQVCMWHACVY